MKNFDRIKQFLNGELSAETHQNFLKELETDEQLREEVKIQQFEEDALDWMVKENIRKQVAELKEQEKSIGLQKKIFHIGKKPILFILSAAASILLIIFFFHLSRPSSEEIADMLLTKYPVSTEILRSEEQTTTPPIITGLDSIYQIGRINFNSGNYSLAIEHFNTYLVQTKDRGRLVDEAEFLLIIAHLKNGEIELAKKLCHEWSKDPNHRYQPAMEEIIKIFR